MCAERRCITAKLFDAAQPGGVCFPWNRSATAGQRDGQVVRHFEIATLRTPHFFFEGSAMTLRDILNVKGTEIFAIDEAATLDDVVQKLVQCNCGSLIVMGPSAGSRRMVGIVTERDILRACACAARPARSDACHRRHDVRCCYRRPC